MMVCLGRIHIIKLNSRKISYSTSACCQKGSINVIYCMDFVKHIMLYLGGLSIFFCNRSIVKSLSRHIVCSEMPKSCIWGVCTSSSSIRRAHLGVMGIGGDAGMLSDGGGSLISGIGGTSEHHSAPAIALFRCISDRPKSESCGVRRTSVTGGGPTLGDDKEGSSPASSWLSPSPSANSSAT